MHPADFHPSSASSRHRVDPTLAVRALETCDRCPVIHECLNYALTHGERDGIWGGTTAKQRYRMGMTARCPSCARRFRLADFRATYCDECRSASNRPGKPRRTP